MLKNIPISKLNKAEYNPRIELNESMPEYKALKRNIEKFGLVEPIVWNKRTGNVVGGHQRLTVLEDLGKTEALCHVVDLPLSDEKVLNLALNKIKGEWDYDKLESVLSEIGDKEYTGFTADELSILLAENEDGIDESFDFSGWDSEEENYTGSYVVDLKFPSNGKAKEWAEEHGYKGAVKEGTYTTVIRVEEKHG